MATVALPAMASGRSTARLTATARLIVTVERTVTCRLMATARVTVTCRPTATGRPTATARGPARDRWPSLATVRPVTILRATVPRHQPATARDPATGLLTATARVPATVARVLATGRLTATAQVPVTGRLTATAPATGGLKVMVAHLGTARHPGTARPEGMARPLVTVRLTVTVRVTASGPAKVTVGRMASGRPMAIVAATASRHPMAGATAPVTAQGRWMATGRVLVPSRETGWVRQSGMAPRPTTVAPAGPRPVTGASFDASTGQHRVVTVREPGKGRRLAMIPEPGTDRPGAVTVPTSAGGLNRRSPTGTTRTVGPQGTSQAKAPTGREMGRPAATSGVATSVLLPVRSGGDRVECRRPGEDRLASQARAARRPPGGENPVLRSMTGTVSGPASSRVPAVPPGPPVSRRGMGPAERRRLDTVLMADLVPSVGGIRAGPPAIPLAARAGRSRGPQASTVILAAGRGQVTEPANPGGQPIQRESPACDQLRSRPRCRRGLPLLVRPRRRDSRRARRS